MKLAVKLVLLMFVIFLSTPTIVGLIKQNCDTTFFYSVSEEELVHKELKEVNAEIKYTTIHFFKTTKLSSSIIISENLLKHDNISASIFSPPPNV